MKYSIQLLSILIITMAVALASCSSTEKQDDSNLISDTSVPSTEATDTGDTSSYRVMKEKYEQFSMELIDYVGSDNFYQWVESMEKPNIVDFVQHFQIPQDTFTGLVRKNYDQETQAYYCEVFQEDLTLSEIQDRMGYSLMK